MVLLFDSRGATDDIDAGIYPKNQILEVAREVGERRGLGSKWLNDDAKIFISPIKPPSGSLCGRLDRSKSGRPIRVHCLQ